MTRTTQRVEPEYAGEPTWAQSFLRSPPGWRLHVPCVVAAASMLWGASTPGHWPLVSSAGIVALVLAGCWLLRLVVHVRVRGRHRRRFLIAPVGGLLLLGLLWSEVPFKARWAIAEGAFDQVVAGLPDVPVSQNWNEDAESLDVPGRIGTYPVDRAERVPGGVLFEGPADCWFGVGGFGWFPEGPDPDAIATVDFTHPTFSHVRGPWYTWCAAW